MDEEHRDIITIEDENGDEKDLIVEALFDMEDNSYALIKDDNDTFLMRIEYEDGDQYLVTIDDPQVKESILDAYEIALEATPGDNEDF